MFSTEARKTAHVLNRTKLQKKVTKVPAIKDEAVRYPDLSRVIHLLEDPLSCSLKEKHILALKKVVKRCQKGYFLRELADVFKILNICAVKAEDHPEYASVLCDLLHICRLPFLKEKDSDETSYSSIVADSLSHMGYLMRVPIAKVREQICASIISFYSLDKPTHYESGVCPTSLETRQEQMEHSGVAETLVMSLALLENQLPAKLQLLHTLQVLSSSSAVNCGMMLKAEGAQKVCIHMNEPDPSGQVLFRSSEILWNLLENGSWDEATGQLSSTDCIMVLKEAFLHQLLRGYRHYDQQLRNDLLVIATLIAENPKASLIESGFAKQLVLLATIPELRSHNPLIRDLKFTFTDEDFEMKKLLLNMVAVLSRDLAAVQLFKENHVMLALVLLVRPSSPDSRPERKGKRIWTPAQQEALQLQALATLATVAPLMLDEYMSCQANTCLLMLLEWCVQQDSYFGQGHCFHGTGGRGGKKAHLRYCIRLLRSMTSITNSLINQDLCDQGAIGQLLGVLHQFQKQDVEEDKVSVEIQTDTLLTLSDLCDRDAHRMELFGVEGVELVVRYLKMDPTRLYSGLGHNILFISAVDCVWSCIAGCYTTEGFFLEKEGAFLLLDLLHTIPRSMQSVVLATLLELCDNPKTLAHVGAWRGAAELSAPALLLRLWRLEEAEIGVRRDEHGRIADVKKPLLSRYQEVESQESVPANRPSAAVLDVAENLRAKIYALFCRLGFTDLPGLTTEDLVTLSVVHRYLDFKIGEVWSEVSAELELEGVRPITPDAEALGTIAKTSEDTARHVLAQQQSILDQKEQEDLQEEKLAYREMSSNRKQQELTAKSRKHHIAKTSDYKTLKESKRLQEMSIESSRPTDKPDGFTFHSTQIPGLQTTNFCGRVLTVESTPAQLTGGPLASTDLALERVPVKGGALRKVTHSNQDMDLPTIVTVK
ncbi:cilia- and flagella-associated protein 69 [Brachyhypopomus gauderio]|uniref:cilia- and flagella-associated protein 69 n=1 Tax=Brachyhypopomus gauderio TaxID=698409 RepID=UPI0040437A57